MAKKIKQLRVLDKTIVDENNMPIQLQAGDIDQINAVRRHDMMYRSLIDGSYEITNTLTASYMLCVSSPCACGRTLTVRRESFLSEDDKRVFKDTPLTCNACNREYKIRLISGELFVKLIKE